MTDYIRLAHGGGGTLMQELINREIVPSLGGTELAQLGDSAKLELPGTNLAFTTDSFVVQPLVFPGGDIGKIAVCGTVNDLAARGAKPIALALSLIIEEGLGMDTLRLILRSVAQAAQEANVEVVTGDTKVVERGSRGIDSGIFITTSGVGLMREGMDFTPDRIKPDDVVIINGPLGDHGIAVMSEREGLSFVSPVKSDAAPLAGMVAKVLDICGEAVKCMKDPTRGGLAANLNEMAREVGFILDEESIPVRPEVRGACEMLGLDVLTVANEGKMIFVARPDVAQDVLACLKGDRYGSEAVLIGKATPQPGRVTLKTTIGAQRIIDIPFGEELPRIC